MDLSSLFDDADQMDLASKNDKNLRTGKDINTVAGRFYVQTLKELEDIKGLLKSGSSQANARSSRGSSGDYRDAGKSPRDEAYSSRRGSGFKSKGFGDSFLDEFEKQLFDAVGGQQFKKDLNTIMGNFAKDLGVQLDGLPDQWGKDLAKLGVDKLFSMPGMKKLQEYSQKQIKEATKRVEEAYRDSGGSYRDWYDKSKTPSGDTQQKYSSNDILENGKDWAEDKLKEKGKEFLDNKKSGKAGKANASKSASTASKAGGGAAKAGVNASKAASGATEAMGVVKQFGALTKAIGPVTKALGAWGLPLAIVTTLFENLAGVMSAFGDAANRAETARKKREENAKNRMIADVKAMVEAPFDILKEAAQKAYQVWDNTLHQITQTQGYTKAEFQELFGEYSQRLRDEGLQAVISSTSIVENLEKVLSSGLTGDAAKEFAYVATKLSQSVPTQDFFSYSESYASLIANQIRLGKSQNQAIEYANEQLESFASNLIYADRQIAGGLSSGLKNGSDLFQKAVEIATAANSTNINGISGVISSVSAITGSIAPDMASGIVDAIYNAALGGNDSSIVALRSLAGGNASNTEFLKNFVNNPQGVFSELFKNLANMQNMSESNYMEVAEGLSSVFGLDKSAFQRVDFNYLAEAVSSMNVNNAALEENVKLLASGQTTLTQEQLRIKQINEYMVDEGLAYVLDNEVARSIQENMWAEQRANAIMENEFAVNLKGEAVNLLREIPEFLFNILNALTFGIAGAARGALDIQRTIDESIQQDKDIKDILKTGKVGTGREVDFKNLTTVGTDLQLTVSYLKQIKQTSAKTSDATYKWEVVGKSMAKNIGTIATGSQAINAALVKNSVSSTDTYLSKLESSFERMKGTMQDFVTTSKQEKMDKELEKQTKRLRKNVTKTDIKKLTKQYVSEFGMLESVAKVRAEDILNKRADEKAAKAAKAAVDEMDKKGKFGQSGYAAWAATASKYGIQDLDEAMADLGYNKQDFENWFNTAETQAAADKEAERNAKEEEFWEKTNEALETLNINVHDVFDKSDMMGIFFPMVKKELEFINYDKNGITEQFKAYRQDFNKYYTEWYNHNVKHTTYSNALLGSGNWAKKDASKTLTQRLDATIKASKKTSEDRLNALTSVLTDVNKLKDLMDPTVQQNVLLAEILKVLQAIMQQNNTQGKLAIPDAIAALATGYTETTKK